MSYPSVVPQNWVTPHCGCHIWMASEALSLPLLFRLCHDVTPMEENKSFLEKARLGGILCGLHEDSIKALTRNNNTEALSYVKQNGASPRRRQETNQLQNKNQLQGHGVSIGKLVLSYRVTRLD